MSQILQIFGAIMILAPFVLTQFRLLSQQSVLYLVLNLVGSALLAILAFGNQQWGFLLLEGSWALVSLWSLAALLCANTRRPAGLH